ncbi:MAG: glycosyltransferase family 2 protein [Oligoflexales bacterium]|nr:glycosyltransferase family 2 protein [Oligoflexales bacterium]
MEPISAIVITKNEEANIARCLNSLHWVDEIILVDSGSTDATLAIAKRFGKVQIVQHPWEGFARNKQIAIEKTKNNWILWVDADEEVPPQLQDEISKLSPDASTGAFALPRQTFFLAKPIRHCGWYPNYVTRLFHKEKAQLNEKILHEGIELVSGTTLKLQQDLHHYSYPSLESFFGKMLVYGQMNAQELQRKGRTFSVLFLVGNPILKFLRQYLFQKGFLDGKEGLIVCMGSAFSTFLKWAFFWQMQEKK